MCCYRQDLVQPGHLESMRGLAHGDSCKMHCCQSGSIARKPLRLFRVQSNASQDQNMHQDKSRRSACVSLSSAAMAVLCHCPPCIAGTPYEEGKQLKYGLLNGWAISSKVTLPDTPQGLSYVRVIHAWALLPVPS